MKASAKRITVTVICLALAVMGLLSHLFPHFFRTEAHSGAHTDMAIDVDAGVTTDRITRIVVLGRDRAAGLTDSILLVTVNETAHRTTVLQIPRDTYASYTDGNYRKLNGVLNVLGERRIKQFFSELLGIRVHYFLILDLSAFGAVVDAIGGVDVNSPCEMHYSDPEQGLLIDLPAGPVHLNGKMAEQFVRYRSGYVNADLGRLDAQKIFLRAFAQKCVALTPMSVLRVLSATLTKLQTDMDLPSALRLASVLRACDPEDTPMATLVGQAVRSSSGAWYFAVNRAGAERMRQEYLMPTAADPAELDPGAILDRPEDPVFHKVYIAPEAKLPMDDS